MQKIIPNLPVPKTSAIVQYKDVDFTKTALYAVVAACGSVGLLQQEKYNAGKFRFVCVNHAFTIGNYICYGENDTIELAILHALGKKTVDQVLKFDNLLEFSKWYVDYQSK